PSSLLRLLFLFSSSSSPPRPTLFPYTTLFRSVRLAAHTVHLRGRRVRVPVVGLGVRPGDRDRGVGLADRDRLGVGGRLVVAVPGDRKSTRLNSSHQIISYAVFCLKKKTIITHA